MSEFNHHIDMMYKAKELNEKLYEIGLRFRADFLKGDADSAVEFVGGLRSINGQVLWHIVGLGEPVDSWAPDAGPGWVSGLIKGALADLVRFYSGLPRGPHFDDKGFHP